MKFVAGDKVRVIRKFTKQEEDFFGLMWMPDMDKTIGKVFTIKSLTGDYSNNWVYQLNTKTQIVYDRYYFEFCLEMVEAKKRSHWEKVNQKYE